MTVAELIQQLQTLPQDYQVYISAQKSKMGYAPLKFEVIDQEEFIKPFVQITTSEK